MFCVLWFVPCSIFCNKEGFILLLSCDREERTSSLIFHFSINKPRVRKLQKKTGFKAPPPPQTLPAKALYVSGVLERSSSETMDRLCSADGLLRGGGKGEISVSLVSWASVSLRRRRLRLLFGVVRDRRDTAFFMAGLSFWRTVWLVLLEHYMAKCEETI